MKNARCSTHAALAALLFGLIPATWTHATTVTVETPLGSFDVDLFEDEAPNTVANFLNYINDGDFQRSFIHRSIPGFILQGGAFVFVNDEVVAIPLDPPVVNEFGRSNVRGTLAMAKLEDDPDSATSSWFINTRDNAENLDNQNGGFTVFGEVLGDGMDVVDQLEALTVWNAGAPFENLPLIDYPGSGNVTDQHMVFTEWTVQPEGEDFVINQGISGAWFNPATPGQGFLIDVDESNQFIFVAWFTHEEASAKLGDSEHRWLTAQGNFTGDEVTLPMFSTTDGAFDNNQATSTTQVGTLELDFTDCTTALFSYEFTDSSLQGDIPVTRVIPGTEALCQSLAEMR